jgi:uncharacterized protein YbaR (Trm112 family)
MNPASIPLAPVCIPIEDRPLDQVACSRCRSTLDLHQPDEQLAERLVGTCPECRAWYLIDAGAGLMLPLPDEADLRRARP